MDFFAKFLTQHPEISDLHLGDHKVPEKDMKNLLEVLAANTFVQKIGFDNKNRHKSAKKELQDEIRRNRKIRELEEKLDAEGTGGGSIDKKLTANEMITMRNERM